MKNNSLISSFGITTMLFVFPLLSSAQVDKKDAEIKKAETGLTIAKNNVAKNERALAVADSLIAKGIEQTNESKAEMKAIATERKALDKEYATSKKTLNKLLSSEDKAEIAKAKTDIKAADLKYKTDTKALDTRLKDSTKKSTTGSANLNKGKTNKSTASDGLKTARQNLEAAQTKYNAATGVAEDMEPKKKKK